MKILSIIFLFAMELCFLFYKESPIEVFVDSFPCFIGYVFFLSNRLLACVTSPSFLFLPLSPSLCYLLWGSKSCKLVELSHLGRAVNSACGRWIRGSGSGRTQPSLRRVRTHFQSDMSGNVNEQQKLWSSSKCALNCKIAACLSWYIYFLCRVKG